MASGIGKDAGWGREPPRFVSLLARHSVLRHFAPPLFLNFSPTASPGGFGERGTSARAGSDPLTSSRGREKTRCPTGRSAERPLSASGVNTHHKWESRRGYRARPIRAKKPQSAKEIVSPSPSSCR